MGTNPWVCQICAGKWYGSNIWDCIYASRKAAQGWVWFVSAPRRLGAILGRSHGLLRHVDVGGVAWEVMWKHNKSEFQRGLIYLLWLVLACLGVLGFCLWFSTVFNCFQLFSTVFNCFQLFSTVFNCFQLFSTVFNCFQLFSTVFNCFQLFSTVFNCFQLFSTVFNCLQLSSTVFNCFQL